MAPTHEDHRLLPRSFDHDAATRRQQLRQGASCHHIPPSTPPSSSSAVARRQATDGAYTITLRGPPETQENVVCASLRYGCVLLAFIVIVTATLSLAVSYAAPPPDGIPCNVNSTRLAEMKQRLDTVQAKLAAALEKSTSGATAEQHRTLAVLRADVQDAIAGILDGRASRPRRQLVAQERSGNSSSQARGAGRRGGSRGDRDSRHSSRSSNSAINNNAESTMRDAKETHIATSTPSTKHMPVDVERRGPPLSFTIALSEYDIFIAGPRQGVRTVPDPFFERVNRDTERPTRRALGNYEVETIQGLTVTKYGPVGLPTFIRYNPFTRHLVHCSRVTTLPFALAWALWDVEPGCSDGQQHILTSITTTTQDTVLVGGFVAITGYRLVLLRRDAFAMEIDVRTGRVLWKTAAKVALTFPAAWDMVRPFPWTVAVARDKAIYVAGVSSGGAGTGDSSASSSGDSTTSSWGGGNDSSSGGSDASSDPPDEVFLVRLAGGTGGEVWRTRLGIYDPLDRPQIAVSGMTVLVVGSTTKSLFALNRGGRDAYVACYNAATGELAWAKQFGSEVDDVASAVTVRGVQVYVAGTTAQASPYPSGPQGRCVAFVTSFYRHYGVEVWTERLTRRTVEEVSSIAVDSRGSVAIAARAAEPPGGIVSGKRVKMWLHAEG